MSSGHVITLAKMPDGKWQAMLLDPTSGHVVDTLITNNPAHSIDVAVERAHQFGPTRLDRRLPILFGGRRVFVDVTRKFTAAWDWQTPRKIAARLGLGSRR